MPAAADVRLTRDRIDDMNLKACRVWPDVVLVQVVKK